jgi:hypothetical protein
MRTSLLATSLVAVVFVALPQFAIASDSPVVPAKVIEFAKEQGIVGLDAGSQAGVSVGDPYWLFSDTGVVGTGEIFFVTAAKSAGRWSGQTQPVAGHAAVVLKRSTLPELRSHMPPGATIAGTVLRLPPGPFTTTLSNNIPLAFGMDVNDATAALAHRYSSHAEFVVRSGLYHVFGNRPGEAGPSCTRVEFVLGSEQRESTTATHVGPGLMVVPVLVLEGGFRALLSQDIKLFRARERFHSSSDFWIFSIFSVAIVAIFSPICKLFWNIYNRPGPTILRGRLSSKPWRP